MSQASKVLKHLKENKKITSVEAIGLYAITRLAAVILQLKKADVAITSTRKKGVHSSYVEYSLTPASELAA